MGKLFEDVQITTIVMIFSIPIIAIISGVVGDVLKKQSDNDLKQSMLNRGMSAEEIEKVMNSGTKRSIKNSLKNKDEFVE